MGLKVKMTTSANRDGVALPNGTVHEFPDDDARALCMAGLATPEGWELPAPAPAADDADDDAGLEDPEPKPAKKAKK